MVIAVSKSKSHLFATKDKVPQIQVTLRPWMPPAGQRRVRVERFPVPVPGSMPVCNQCQTRLRVLTDAVQLKTL